MVNCEHMTPGSWQCNVLFWQLVFYIICQIISQQASTHMTSKCWEAIGPLAIDRTTKACCWDRLILNVTTSSTSSGPAGATSASRKAGSSGGVESEILFEIPDDDSVMTSPVDENLQYWKVNDLTMVFFGHVCPLATWPIVESWFLHFQIHPRCINPTHYEFIVLDWPFHPQSITAIVLWSIPHSRIGEYVDENASGPAGRPAAQRGPSKPVTNIPLTLTCENDGQDVAYGGGSVQQPTLCWI